MNYDNKLYLDEKKNSVMWKLVNLIMFKLIIELEMDCEYGEILK